MGFVQSDDDELLKWAGSFAAEQPSSTPASQPKKRKSAYDSLIADSSARHGVDPDLIRAQMGQESSGNPNATSPKGAGGLMQLMPDTAKRLGVSNIYDPKQNIEGGTKLMKSLLDRYKGNVDLALAAYNAGEGAVDKYGKKIPPYKETRDYVAKIRGNYKGNGYLNAPDTINDADLLSWANSFVPQTDTAPPDAQPTPTNPANVMSAPSGQLPVPVPETQTALASQIQSLKDPASTRAAVLLTPGEVPPPEVLSSKEYGVFPSDHGALVVNLNQAKKLKLRTRADVQGFIDNNPDAIARLTGKVETANDTSTGYAVQTFNKDGQEIHTSKVTTPEAARAQAKLDRQNFTDAASQKVLPIQTAVANRVADAQAEQPAEQAINPDALTSNETTSPTPLDNQAERAKVLASALPGESPSQTILRLQREPVEKAYQDFLKQTGLPDEQSSVDEFNLAQKASVEGANKQNQIDAAAYNAQLQKAQPATKQGKTPQTAPNPNAQQASTYDINLREKRPDQTYADLIQETTALRLSKELDKPYDVVQAVLKANPIVAADKGDISENYFKAQADKYGIQKHEVSGKLKQQIIDLAAKREAQKGEYETNMAAQTAGGDVPDTYSPYEADVIAKMSAGILDHKTGMDTIKSEDSAYDDWMKKSGYSDPDFLASHREEFQRDRENVMKTFGSFTALKKQKDTSDQYYKDKPYSQLLGLGDYDKSLAASQTYNRTRLSDEQLQSARNVGSIAKQAEATNGGGSFGSQFISTLTTSLAQAAAGITRAADYLPLTALARWAAGDNAPKAEDFDKLATMSQIAGETAKGDGIVYEVTGTLGTALGGFPRLVGATVLAGGNPILGFGLDSLVSNTDKPAKEQFKNLTNSVILGAVFSGASKLATSAAKAVSEKFLSEETAAALKDPAIQQAYLDAKAAGEKVTLTPDLKRAIFVNTLVKNGTRIGLVGGTGYVTTALEGGSERDRWKTAITWAAMEAVSGIFGKKPGEPLTEAEINKASERVIRVPDDKGKPHDVLLLKGADGLEAHDVTGKVDSSVIDAEILPKPGEKGIEPPTEPVIETKVKRPVKAQSPIPEENPEPKTAQQKADEFAGKLTPEDVAKAETEAKATVAGKPAEVPVKAETPEVTAPTVSPERQRMKAAAAKLFPEKKGFRIVGGGELSRDVQRRDLAIRQAETSPVTGLPNKVAFEKARKRVDADPNMEVTSIDLNKFKSVNDLNDHIVGDKALNDAGQALQKAAKSVSDQAQIFHLSGDEFAITAPKGQGDKILALADKDFGNKAYGKAVTSIGGHTAPTYKEAEAGLQAAKAKRKGELSGSAPDNLIGLQSQAEQILITQRAFHPDDAAKYVKKLGGVKELQGFIADNPLSTSIAVKPETATKPKSLVAQRIEAARAKKYVAGDLTPTEVKAQTSDPAFLEAEAKSQTQKEDSRTGYTTAQKQYLSKELADYAKEYPKNAPYFGETSISIVDKTIIVPDDGTVKVNSLRQANRLHQRITGKPLNSKLPKEKAAVSPAMGTNAREFQSALTGKLAEGSNVSRAKLLINFEPSGSDQTSGFDIPIDEIDANYIGGKKLESSYEPKSLGKGWLQTTINGREAYTNGNILLAADEPFGSGHTIIKPDGDKVLKHFTDNDNKPVAPVRAVTTIEKGKKYGGLTTVEFEDGKFIPFKQYNLIKAHYPNATFQTSEGTEAPIGIFDGKEIVGLVMPLRDQEPFNAKPTSLVAQRIEAKRNEALRSVPATNKLSGIIDSKGQIDYEQAKDVAGRIERGELEINRLDRQGERGRLAGGKRTLEASVLLGADEYRRQAASQGGGSNVESRSDTQARQEKLLEVYAKREGIWYDWNKYFRDKHFTRGGEAFVYRQDDNHVVKTIDYRHIDKGLTPLGFLDNRIALFNHIFPETHYELMGLTKDNNGKLRFLVKQPFIDVHGVSKADVTALMAGKGFKELERESYTNGLYNVFDVHEKNATRDAGHNYYVIDAVPKPTYELSPLTVTEPSGEALRSVPAQTESPAFERWFGDSKVVDENGQPLVVYHGTGDDFNAFDASHIGKHQYSDWGQGFYFTPSKSSAHYYRTEAVKKTDKAYNDAFDKHERLTANVPVKNGSPQYSEESKIALQDFQRIGRELDNTKKGRVLGVYLKLENPLIQPYRSTADPYLAEIAKEHGHDGIIVLDYDGNIDEIVAFDRKQIKSATDNNGNFDQNDSNILRKVRTPEELDALTELTKSNDFSEIVPKVASSVEGKNIVSLDSPEAAETVRTMLALSENADRGKAPVLQGLFLDPKQVTKLRDAADVMAETAKEQGVDPKPLTDLIANLDKAAKSNGTVKLKVFEDAMEHESVHESSYLGAPEKNYSKRYANAEELRTYEPFQTFHKALEQRMGMTVNHGVAMEEALAYLGTGDYKDFGLTKEHATEILARLVEGYAEANGVESLKNFTPGTQLYEAIENHVSQNTASGQSESGEGRNEPGGGIGRQGETRPDNAAKADQGNADAQGPRERNVDDTGLDTFTPGGKEKLSASPETMRGNNSVFEAIEDRPYIATTNVERMEFANRTLDKGTTEATKWLNEQLKDGNNNAGATQAVGLSLMNHLGRNGDLAGMNDIAKRIVTKGTDNAQAVQAMSLVAQFDPESAASYASLLKQRKLGKDLTDAERKRATSIAVALDETAKTDALGEAALADAQDHIKELEAENEAITEALANKPKESKTDVANLKRQLTRWKNKVLGKSGTVGRVTRTHRELLERKADILARLHAKFPNAPLRMVAWHGSPHRFEKFDISKIGTGEGSYNYVIFDDKDVEIQEVLRSVPPASFDDQTRQDLTDYTAIQILNGKTYKDVINELSDITNGTLNEDEVKAIHANAVASIRGESPTAKMSAEKLADVRRRIKNRNEHRSEARKFTGANKNPNLSRLELEILDIAPNDKARIAAAILARTPDTHIWYDTIEHEYPEMTPAEKKALYVEATDLKRQAQKNLERKRLENQKDIKLTDADVARIKEEKRVNNVRAHQARKDAEAFYNGLVRTKWDVSLETLVNLRRANLLTGIKTHLRNIFGNIGFDVSEEALRPLAFLADRGIGLLTGEKTIQGISPVGIVKGFYNMFKPGMLKDIDRQSGIQAAKNIMSYGDTLDNLERQQHSESVLSEKFGGKLSGKIARGLDTYINTVFRTLGAEDALAKVYAFRRSLEEQADALAKTELAAKQITDWKARRKELIANPTQTMQMVADDFANFMTFQNDNTLSHAFTRFKRLHPGIKIVSETIVPYDRTPTNIVVRVLEHLPVVGQGITIKQGIEMRSEPNKLFKNRYRGAVEADLTNEEWQKLSDEEKRKRIDDGIAKAWTRDRQARFARTVGRSSFGTSLFMTGFGLAAFGLLTGSMSPDDEDKAQTSEFFKRKQMGVENKSLRVPGVGRFVLPDDPASKTLAAGATFYEQMQMSKGDPVIKAWEASKEVTKDALFEQPLVGNVGQLYNSLKKGKAGEITGNILGGMLVPTMVADLGEVEDEKARTSSGYKKVPKGTIPTAQSRLEEQGRGFRNTFLRRIPFARHLADESDATVSPAERGGLLRRGVRMFDLLNTRSDIPYTAPKQGEKAAPKPKPTPRRPAVKRR